MDEPAQAESLPTGRGGVALNLHHLAIFHAVAQEGSVSRGAERLCLSQPAVSRQLRDLESAVGQVLFDRLPRGVRLTVAGELLARYAGRIFHLQAEAELALAELAGLRRGRLALGASTTIGIYLLPEVFGMFRLRHPAVDLSMEISNTALIQQQLVDGLVDAVLTEGFVDRPELEGEVFHEDELVGIAPPRHALLQQPAPTVAEFCRQPVILREPGSGTRAVVEVALRTMGIEVRPSMSLGSTEAIKRAVAAGVGVAIVSRLTVAQELETGRLAIVPLADLVLRRPLHLVRSKGRADGVALRAFLGMLRTFLG